MIQAIDRAARVLQLLQGARHLGIAELAQALDLAPSTVHGIVKTLQAHGLVVQEPHGTRYMLGPALLKLSNVYLDTLDVRARARRWTAELARRTGYATRLGVELFDEVIIIHHDLRPDDSEQMPETGVSIPAHASALGKVLLAYNAQLARSILQPGTSADAPSTPSGAPDASHIPHASDTPGTPDKPGTPGKPGTPETGDSLAVRNHFSEMIPDGERTEDGRTGLSFASRQAASPRSASPQPSERMLRALTGDTVTSPAELAEQFPRIRERGYAQEVDEAILGESSIAAPIADRAGTVVAAVGVVLPTSEWPAAEGVLNALRETARNISRELGAPGWPPLAG